MLHQQSKVVEDNLVSTLLDLGESQKPEGDMTLFGRVVLELHVGCFRRQWVEDSKGMGIRSGRLSVPEN